MYLCQRNSDPFRIVTYYIRSLLPGHTVYQYGKFISLRTGGRRVNGRLFQEGDLHRTILRQDSGVTYICPKKQHIGWCRNQGLSFNPPAQGWLWTDFSKCAEGTYAHTQQKGLQGQ